MHWKGGEKMNGLRTFSFESTSNVRTVVINNEPWFVGKDVAEVLGYSDTSDALKKHVDNEDKLTRQFADSGQKRNMYIINESGLYALIFGSKLPSAKNFKRWVTSEVLPAIRKTGQYQSKQKQTDLKSIVKLISTTKQTMKEQGSSPHDIAVMMDSVCKQYGIILPDCFVRPESLNMKDVMDMFDFIYSHPRGKGHKKPSYEDFIAYKTQYANQIGE